MSSLVSKKLFCFKVWGYVGCAKPLKGGGSYVAWVKTYTKCELREETAVTDAAGKWIPKNKKLRDVADVGPNPKKSPKDGAKATSYRSDGKKYIPGGQTATPPDVITGAAPPCKCYECYDEYDISTDVNSRTSTSFNR